MHKSGVKFVAHYNDDIMSAIASQITSLTSVYSTVYSDADQRKHQSSASLAFVRGIHRWPVNSPHKWPVTRKMFPFDDVIMACTVCGVLHQKQVSRAGTSNNTQQMLWGVITCPRPWYPLLAQHSSYVHYGFVLLVNTLGPGKTAEVLQTALKQNMLSR